MPKGISAYNQRNGKTVVEKLANKSVLAPNGCRVWTGPINHWGYGRVAVDGVTLKAHRVAWTEAHGQIAAGLCVLHRCDNPPCINVDHLFLGTQGDNARDRVAKGRHARGERAGGAKLSVAQVRVIRADKRKLRVLAKEYGVAESAISNVRQGRRWAHIQ